MAEYAHNFAMVRVVIPAQYDVFEGDPQDASSVAA